MDIREFWSRIGIIYGKLISVKKILIEFLKNSKSGIG